MQVFISDLICLGKTRWIHCFWLVLLIVFSLTSCKKEHVATKEYPRLNTLEVTGINESGAIFNAEIISGNRAEIKEYGFVWDTSLTPEINSDDKLVKTGVPDNIKFSGNIHSALKKDIPYNVRAYVKTDKYLVYGKIVSFKSMGSDAPSVSSFSPESGTWGDTIKIKGKNFRYRMNGIVVKLGDIPATLISSTDTTINIVVPSVKNAEKVLLSVSIEGNNSVSGAPFSYLIPVISAINPLTATFNDTVFIHGNNFITGAMNYSVYDLLSDKWSLLGNMQKFINYDEWSKAAGFVINDNIYLCGGYARNYYYGYSGYKKTWRFDVATDQWTQLSDFPIEMEAPAGFSINGKGYIGAGSSNGQGKSDFYEYDPVNDIWSRIADLPVKGSIGPVEVVIGGKAYISANNNTEIWEFDPLAH